MSGAEIRQAEQSSGAQSEGKGEPVVLQPTAPSLLLGPNV